ncbi:COX15/CtaA family protein [Poritiphilus flavus]|uniref:Heme A synthase n=1 Tax=Poritiphilus flavus TaxID=2697053 RepID=A0A6L9E966_9FLAO|nr:COX15/CtaA family protein [Poritiphilus flavus]NAS11270.1 heme A synthase [Poritiphilus flavus]
MKLTYHRLAKISLILVYLVIAAGAVVRMTGSGMGCPDWPKCFGYYIPPTTSGELEWRAQKSYKKGQVIIKNEALWVAVEDFTTTDSYSDGNWEEYTRHDYAAFNAAHTWIEYINRLLGALAGLATLALALFSFRYWKSVKKITLLSWLVVFGMGFQAWLGATVVYSVLEPVKITMHMVMALIIVAFLIYLIHETGKRPEIVKFDKLTANLLWLALGFTLIQVVLGTQVRQFVDEQIDLVGEQAKQLWLAEPQIQFYIHRSFSILVVLLNTYIAFRIYKLKLGLSPINWVLVLILVEVITGVAMNYMDFPFGTQPLHLILASLLFGVQIYLVLETRKANKSLKTL